QRRAQNNFFSLKGFSEVGTGVMRGSSHAWASQYMCCFHVGTLTLIRQKLASIFSCSTSFLACPTLMVLFTGVSPF
ncbi:guanine nucleotide-binding protein GI/GS/GO subunit gamma-3, partial [Triplophysa rosa]